MRAACQDRTPYRVRARSSYWARVVSRKSDGPTFANEALAAHGENVERYRAGEAKVLNFLMGQVMRRTQGKADPAVVKALLVRKLDGPPS